MEHLLLLIKLCFLLCQHGRKTAGEFVDPDSYRNVSELITSKGYPLEEHTVQTSDGYLLSVQRIPHGKNGSSEEGQKKVVLLVHGELGDGKTWFLNPPGQSLGYVLPDEGYDVWILNNRGTDYSRKHVRYTTNDYRFWDFSFNEIGLYDVPATIDHILQATGAEKLSIIGYSRGNTDCFAMFSELPAYNDKVNIFMAFAPVTFLGHFRSAVRPLTYAAEAIAAPINLVTKGEFLKTNKVTKIITAKFCEANDLEICQAVIFAIAGPDPANLNMTRVPIYAAQYPSSTSTKSLVHFSQLIRTGTFRKYDYKLRNFKYYGQLTPPDYQLSQITAPVALFWSKNDAIATTKDVEKLRTKLRKGTLVSDNQIPNYNHFDFIIAKNSFKLINEPVLKLLEQY